MRGNRVGLGRLEVIEILGGPIAPHRPARQAARQERERLWASAGAHPALVRRPQLESWLVALREFGLLARAIPDPRLGVNGSDGGAYTTGW